MNGWKRAGMRVLWAGLAIWNPGQGTFAVGEEEVSWSDDAAWIDTLLDPGTDDAGLRAVEPELRRVLREWVSISFVREIRKQDPRGTLRFLESCLRLNIESDLLDPWVNMMPESVGVEYELLSAGSNPEQWVPRLLRRTGELKLLLDILLRPEYRDRIPERVWPELVDALISSKQTSAYYLGSIRHYDSYPEPFLKAAESMASSRDNQNQLVGLYLSSFRMAEGEGEEFRQVTTELIRSAGEKGDWLPVIQEVDLTPVQAFRLAGGRAAAVRLNRDKTFQYLAEIADEMGGETLLARLLEESTNLDFLRMYATRRPEWIHPLGMALLDDLEREFTLIRMNRTAWYLQLHDSFQPPIGRFDDVWLSRLRAETKTEAFVIRHAYLIGIHPELIWNELQKHREFITEDTYHQYGLEGNMLHMIEHGDPKLVREVLASLRSERPGDPARFPRGESILKKALGKYPDKVSDRFPIQLEAFATYLKNRTRWGLTGQMFWGKILDAFVPDFFEQHRVEILERLESGRDMDLFYPVLCMLAVDDGLREAHGDLFRRGILQASTLTGLTERQRFTIAFAGILLGMKEERLDRDFLAYFSHPGIADLPTWRIYFLLDESHARFLPDLLKASDTGKSPGVALLTALMINPSHPEVEKRVRKALFEGKDHGLACTLASRLNFFGKAPPLDAYPDGRLEWLMDADTKEKYDSMRIFLRAYDREAHERLLPLLLPKFNTFASFKPFNGLKVLFEDNPANQRTASGRLIDMLDSLDSDFIDFACENLQFFDTLSRKELGVIGKALHRLQDKLNLNPRLFRALSNLGREAAFLEEEVARLTREGSDHNHDDAFGCLANISVDKERRRESLDQVKRLFRDTYKGSTGWQSGYVRNIGFVREQEERVIPFLKQVVDEYVNPRPGRPVDVDAAKQALWGLSRQRADADLFDYYRDLMRLAAVDPQAGPLLETILWCLSNEFDHLLPELQEDLETVPLRFRATFVYRKIREDLRRRE